MAISAATGRTFLLVVTIALLSGCEKPSLPARTDTGAEAVAKSFFEALVREDWSGAYSALDSESHSLCSKEQFVNRGQAARKQIGFTPTEVNVAVSEVGDRATAIAVYRESSGTSQKQYRDGATLRRIGESWAVILRLNFGAAAPIPAGRRFRNRRLQ